MGWGGHVRTVDIHRAGTRDIKFLSDFDSPINALPSFLLSICLLSLVPSAKSFVTLSEQYQE